MTAASRIWTGEIEVGRIRKKLQNRRIRTQLLTAAGFQYKIQQKTVKVLLLTFKGWLDCRIILITCVIPDENQETTKSTIEHKNLLRSIPPILVLNP